MTFFFLLTTYTLCCTTSLYNHGDEISPQNRWLPWQLHVLKPLDKHIVMPSDPPEKKMCQTTLESRQRASPVARRQTTGVTPVLLVAERPKIKTLMPCSCMAMSYLPDGAPSPGFLEPCHQ